MKLCSLKANLKGKILKILADCICTKYWIDISRSHICKFSFSLTFPYVFIVMREIKPESKAWSADIT